MPQMEKQRAAQQAQSEMAKPAPQDGSATPSTAPQTGAGSAPSANAPAQPASAAPAVSRDTAVAATPRLKVHTPRLIGSMSLNGRRIDQLPLVRFRETVGPPSPALILYSPSGTAHP